VSDGVQNSAHVLFDAENEKAALPIMTSKQADRGAAGGRPGFGQHAIIQRPQAI
jgi:hypothetical protein